MPSWGQCFSPSHTRSCLLPLQSEKLSWEKGLGRQGTVPGEGNVLKTQGSVLPPAHPRRAQGTGKHRCFSGVQEDDASSQAPPPSSAPAPGGSPSAGNLSFYKQPWWIFVESTMWGGEVEWGCSRLCRGLELVSS